MPTNSALQSDSRFAMTRWSMILAAKQWPIGSAAQQAMNELAQVYWFPLYAYLRRKGSNPEAAQDLVQGFFVHLLEKDAMGKVDQSKGKFRAFLLASLKNFQANTRDADRALKRGGGRSSLSLDTMAAEQRYAVEPADSMTPERLFDRQWALAVLDQVLGHLRQDYASRDQSVVFNALEHVLVGGMKISHAQVASQLQITESAVKVAVHRLRRRYRELLRHEIAQTVDDPALVDQEIKELLNCL